MKKSKDTSELLKVLVKATRDKETKRTNRYSLDKNEHGISGVIYLDKEDYPKPAKTIKIKLLIP